MSCSCGSKEKLVRKYGQVFCPECLAWEEAQAMKKFQQLKKRKAYRDQVQRAKVQVDQLMKEPLR